jgi:hypothetical protein
LDLPHDFDRTRRAGHDARAERGQVEFLNPRFGELRDEHARHAVQGRTSLVGHGLERQERSEGLSRRDNRRAACGTGEVAHHHAEAVIERHRHADPVQFGVAERFPQKVRVVENVVVRQCCAFRRAGRARRVLNVDRVVELQ